uniref:Uncharacterized protein n=1 Tax=Pfiesteria piscicida TaxID=71001 RepID=A3E3N3_PFIPI|nr:unknown [Pfiesteria piscicida]
MGLPEGPKFLGVLPLAASVAVAFVLCVARALVMLYSLSSYSDYVVAGVRFEELFQTAVATLGLAGPPLAVLAGFGVMFTMAKHVRALAIYLGVVTALELGSALFVLLNGGVCGAVAHEVLITRSPLFICLFIYLASFFWGAIIVGLECYIVFAVHQLATAVEKRETEEWLRYTTAVPHW